MNNNRLLNTRFPFTLKPQLDHIFYFALLWVQNARIVRNSSYKAVNKKTTIAPCNSTVIMQLYFVELQNWSLVTPTDLNQTKLNSLSLTFPCHLICSDINWKKISFIIPPEQHSLSRYDGRCTMQHLLERTTKGRQYAVEIYKYGMRILFKWCAWGITQTQSQQQSNTNT